MSAVEDEELAASCGLYCGACIDYLVLKAVMVVGANVETVMLLVITKDAIFIDAVLLKEGLKLAMSAENSPVQRLSASAITLFGSIICQLSITCDDVKLLELKSG